MSRAVFLLLCAANLLYMVSSQETIEEYNEQSSSDQASEQAASQTSSSTSEVKKNGQSINSSRSSSSSKSSSSGSSSKNSFSSKKVTSDSCDKCKENERWVECPPILCVPETCDQLGGPISCPRIIPGMCPVDPACVCIEGYVRNAKGICIPKGNCPSCNGDTNAEAGCGFLCGETCDNQNSPPIPCPCLINGCQCKSGFVYDANQGKCVYPCECTPSCPENEVYNTCPLPCPPRVCGIHDAVVLCPADQPCLPPSCSCQHGHYRNKDDKCVLWEDCPVVPPPCGGPVTVTPDECPENLKQLIVTANAKLTGLFLHDSMTRKPGENLIMSAFSLLTPIAQLCYFSEGETLRQCLEVLNLSSKEHIRCVFPPLLDGLTADQNVILNLAVRIFTSDAFPLTQNFLDYTRDVFDAVAESLDFSNGVASARRINEWAANATNDRINSIATQDMFDAYTRLVLANAIYFLGNWIYPFNENNTDYRVFHISNNAVATTPMMYQLGTFKYGYSEKYGAQFLEMFYKGGSFSLFIVLPDEIEGLEACVETFQSPDVFYEAYNSTTYQKVHVYLPKMQIESKFNLYDIFNESGMTDYFDPAKSNLQGILQNYEPLHISSGIQNAFIKVNELGTEAAAVNVITVGTTSVQLPTEIYTFNCNHPFFAYIMHEEIPLFAVIHSKPSPVED